MSVNFNIALLRSLKEPLMDSLKKLHEQLQEILDGKRDPRAFEAGEAHMIVGSLSMINARGARVIAETIETLTQALQAGTDPRFQNPTDLHQGAKAAQQGIKALELYLSDLINGSDDQPVKLWSAWSRMVLALGQNEPNPDALYFPAPVFDDETFLAVQANDLKMRVESARRRFDEGATQWANAEGALAAETGLKQVQDVIGELYGLRHRKGFQGYWLALSARVQAALLHPQQERDDKRPLGAVLDQASVELRKFAEDQKKVSDDTLRAVVLPLVNGRTLDLAHQHPVFADLDRRFGIRSFLRAAQHSSDVESQARQDNFVHRQAEIKDNLHAIKAEWAKHIGVSLDKRALIKGLTALLQKRDIFPGDAAPHLLGALATVVEHYTARLTDKVNEVTGAEVATLLVMLDALVERRGQTTDEFAQQSDLQKRRVQATLADRLDDLKALPHASWDQQTRKEQARQAMRHVVQEVKKDLAHIERILDDVLREREDSMERLGEVPTHARVALGALRIMKQESAARILEAVRDTATLFGQKGHVVSDPERERVTVGLGALTMFLNAYESGDVRAHRMLAPALKALFNEDLPEDEDTDAFVPSIAPVDHAVTPDLPVDAEPEVPLVPPSFDAPVDLPPLGSEPVSPVSAPPGMSDWVGADAHHEPEAPGEAEVTPAEPVVDPATQPGWDESSDPMIAEVFLEEAVEALDTVALELSTLQRSPTDHDALTTVRRQFHTLKGSGRMAQFDRLGMVAWWIEERLNEVLETGETPTRALFHAVDTAASAIRGWIGELAAAEKAGQPLRVWVDGTPVAAILAAEHPGGHHHDDTGPLVPPKDEDLALPQDDDVEPLEPTPTEAGANDAHHEPEPIVEPVSVDPVHVPALPAVTDDVHVGQVTISGHLYEQFAIDVQKHVDILHGEVSAWYLDQGGWTVSDSFGRSAHTLRSLGRTVGFTALASLGGALEARSDQALQDQEILTIEVIDVLEDAVDGLRNMVHGILSEHQEPVARPDLEERLQAISRTNADQVLVESDDLGDTDPLDDDLAVTHEPVAPSAHDEAHVETPVHTEPVLHEPDTSTPAHAPVDVHEPAPIVPMMPDEPLLPVDVEQEAPPAAPAPVDEAPIPALSDIAEAHDPWDDALDALSVIAQQVQRLTVAFETLAKSRQ